MEQRAPSATKISERPFTCRCGAVIPKTSYLCSPCWTGLNTVQQADLRFIRKAIRDRRFDKLPMLARG